MYNQISYIIAYYYFFLLLYYNTLIYWVWDYTIKH